MIENTKFPHYMTTGLHTKSRGHEFYMDISISLIGMMVFKHTIYDSFYSILGIVYSNFEIIISSENRIYDIVFP